MNEKTNIYGLKLLISEDTITWDDHGVILELPTRRMPRNRYIRPKIHCGGVTSTDKHIKLFLYTYKSCKIEYFTKEILIKEIISNKNNLLTDIYWCKYFKRKKKTFIIFNSERKRYNTIFFSTR